jgi:hypothetical protein
MRARHEFIDETFLEDSVFDFIALPLRPQIYCRLRDGAEIKA